MLLVLVNMADALLLGVPGVVSCPCGKHYPLLALKVRLEISTFKHFS